MSGRRGPSRTNDFGASKSLDLGEAEITDPVNDLHEAEMGKKLDLEPVSSESTRTPETIVRLPPTVESIVRWKVPESLKDKQEAEQIVTSVSEKDYQWADDAFRAIAVFLFGALTCFALVIVLLYVLRRITLSTALLLGVVIPLLSGILVLMNALVRHVTRSR
jgi:hypothetical protein